HSQGAAIAHAALQTATFHEPAPSTNAFVTFGAGLRKLKELERLSFLSVTSSWSVSLGIVALSSALWLTVNWLLAGPPSGLELARMLGLPTPRDFFGVHLFAAWWIFPVMSFAGLGVLTGILALVTDRKFRSLQGLLVTFLLSIYLAVGGLV